MTKRVLITYKWNKERGEHKWLFWLQKKLEEQGLKVILSKLETPRTKTHEWVRDLQAIYDIPDHSIHFVDHDPGCLTILKYLEYLAASEHIETALLVAGKNVRPQAPQENYVRLDTSDKIAIFDRNKQSPKDRLENVDARLVVLYSMDNDMISSPHNNQLERGNR